MNISKCRMCGDKIDIYRYRNALFCSDKCKKRHYDATHRRSKLKQNKTLNEGVTNTLIETKKSQNQ